MASVKAKISHDHDYCVLKEKEGDNSKSTEKDTVQQEWIESPCNSLCLSPTYSCDSGLSGIDTFACNLAQEFDKESDDLLDLFLDEDFLLSLGPPEDKEVKIDDKLPNISSPFYSGIKSKTNLSEKVLAVDSSDTKQDITQRNRKNAENARENRKKKKSYVFQLEKEVTQLRAEKNVLTGKSFRLEGRLNELEEEVDYLKSILANQSMLSKLLGNLSVTAGVSLSTSFCSSRKTATEELKDGKENTVTTRSRKRGCSSQKASQQGVTSKRSCQNESGGICLHVKGNKVSLEFCHICSKTAED